MKIRYNIANNKKINYFRFGLTVVIVLGVSLLFTAMGIHNLSATAKQFRDRKNDLEMKREKLENIVKANEADAAEIQNIKKRWSKKIDFANGIINDKTFPFMEKLEKLENLLPAGVYILNLTLSPKTGSTVVLDIAAVSSERLLEAYNVFLTKYSLVIKRESTKDGKFSASLQIKL